MEIWNTLAGAFFGSLVATLIVARLTQGWIETRERRNRRDDLRLQLYLDVVDLVLENERALAHSDATGRFPPEDLQTRRIHISHRLTLLASPAVQEAYQQYARVVFQETAQDLQFRSKDPHEVVRARDRLIHAMAADMQ
jgi:hypothetical protein